MLPNDSFLILEWYDDKVREPYKTGVCKELESISCAARKKAACSLCRGSQSLKWLWALQKIIPDESTALETCNVMEATLKETEWASWGGMCRLSMEWPHYSVFSIGTPFRVHALRQFHGKDFLVVYVPEPILPTKYGISALMIYILSKTKAL